MSEQLLLNTIYNVGMSTAEAYTPQDEGERIFAWRAQCLYDAGLRDIHVAKQLALSDCDLHRACAMIRQGCEAKVLAKILV